MDFFVSWKVLWRPGTQGILMQNVLLEGSWWFFTWCMGLWAVKFVCFRVSILCEHMHNSFGLFRVYLPIFDLSWPLHPVTNLKAKLQQTAQCFASSWLVPVVFTWPIRIPKIYIRHSEPSLSGSNTISTNKINKKTLKGTILSHIIKLVNQLSRI